MLVGIIEINSIWGTHSYKVATPRCVNEISELICANSCFSLRTRSLDTARSAFSSSGSYLELIEVVEEETERGREIKKRKY